MALRDTKTYYAAFVIDPNGHNNEVIRLTHSGTGAVQRELDFLQKLRLHCVDALLQCCHQ